MKDTFDLINSVFANPNRYVVEVPDCNHSSFGDHIRQVFDAKLNKDTITTKVLKCYVK